MMQKQQKMIQWCAALAVSLAALSGFAYAGDDTARFYGTWKGSFVFNGQTINMISTHDATGYKTYMVLPTGNALAGQGAFSAVNGKWTADAPAPNNGGRYYFIGNNTAVCTNAAGQKLTWHRQTSASTGGGTQLPPNPNPPSPAPGDNTSPPPPSPSGNGTRK
jgi:hypothetical protein